MPKKRKTKKVTTRTTVLNPRSTFSNMAWSQDMLVRDIASEVDDRPHDEIAESIMEVYEQYDRGFEEPKELKHLTKKQAADTSILASQIVDWANYGIAYGDYSNPPWEHVGNPRKAKPITTMLGKDPGVQWDRLLKDIHKFDGDQLRDVWSAIQKQPRRIAVKLFPQKPTGYVSATHVVANLASNMAVALGCKRRGEPDSAAIYSYHARQAYERLPKYAKPKIPTWVRRATPRGPLPIGHPENKPFSEIVRTRSGNPRGQKPTTPWVTKHDQWMPSPEGVSRGSRFYGGGYWTVMRQGGLSSGGLKTRALATAWKASSEFKRRYAARGNPKSQRCKIKSTKRTTNVRSLVSRALK